MNTPIHDFVTRYRDLRPARFHMPGHKGRGPLGCEELDLTEIPGADSLYEAQGIIAESEANASRLFGCPTFYSTEGSSQCIRAMLQVAVWIHTVGGGVFDAPHAAAQRNAGPLGTPAPTGKTGFRVLAARNVHKTFLSAAALLDLDAAWLDCPGASYLSAEVTPAAVEAALAKTGASAVYLTAPDYLGCMPEIAPIAEVCHAHGALLLVDNAHGAYLRFLKPSRHPMDLGADLCCDSAHKTFPVLTGGAYLHVAGSIADRMHTGNCGDCPPEADLISTVREALAIFGSTSPSYLILQSLDLANPFLETLPEKLSSFLPKIDALLRELSAAGCRLYGQEPLKLTLAPRSSGLSGTTLAALLEESGIFCEFADPDFVTLMLSPANTEQELVGLRDALLRLLHAASGEPLPPLPAPERRRLPRQICSIREAMMAPAETVPADDCLGRILARPGVSCPPAVPILMPGEQIDAEALEAFSYYGIETCRVLQK